jgi:hypothetical protein
LIIPRGNNNGAINTKGQINIMTSSSGNGQEKASATFEEIGHSDANGCRCFSISLARSTKIIIIYSTTRNIGNIPTITSISVATNFPFISSLIGTWSLLDVTVSLNYSTTIKYIQNLVIEL